MLVFVEGCGPYALGCCSESFQCGCVERNSFLLVLLFGFGFDFSRDVDPVDSFGSAAVFELLDDSVHALLEGLGLAESRDPDRYEKLSVAPRLGAFF